MVAKLLIASIITGLISGFFITFYSLLITFLTYFFFQGDPFKTIPTLPVWYLYLLPTVAIFVVNAIVSKDANVKEYGLNEVADSIIENRMKLSLRTLFMKIFASALSLSAGFTVGTEGPSASIGAMVAYHIHKWFRLPSMLVKMMISIGASSGIAAIFVSPMTGIAFAVEIIAYQFIKQYIGYLILASFVSFSVAIYYLDPIVFLHSQGRGFDFSLLLPHLIFLPFITLFVYFYLFLKKRVLSFVEWELFYSFARYRNYLFALIGGILIGTILMVEPRAAFSGHTLVLGLINSDEMNPSRGDLYDTYASHCRYDDGDLRQCRRGDLSAADEYWCAGGLRLCRTVGCIYIDQCGAVLFCRSGCGGLYGCDHEAAVDSRYAGTGDYF